MLCYISLFMDFIQTHNPYIALVINLPHWCFPFSAAIEKKEKKKSHSFFKHCGNVFCRDQWISVIYIETLVDSYAPLFIWLPTLSLCSQKKLCTNFWNSNVGIKGPQLTIALLQRRNLMLPSMCQSGLWAPSSLRVLTRNWPAILQKFGVKNWFHSASHKLKTFPPRIWNLRQGKKRSDISFLWHASDSRDTD